MKKLLALWNLMRKGEQVANPAAWKNGQIAANLAAFILAIAALVASFGFNVEVTDAQAMAMAGGVVAAYNVVLTVITSRKVGLPAKAGGDAVTDTP